MKRITQIVVAAALAAAFAALIFANTVHADDEPMFPNKTIVGKVIEGTIAGRRCHLRPKGPARRGAVIAARSSMDALLQSSGVSLPA